MSENGTTLKLREALLDRWLGEDDDPAEWTDEMLMKRIEDLVGEGWYHAGKEAERGEQLRAAVTSAMSYPRFLSIGSIDNTVEIRMDRARYAEIRELLSTEAISVGR